MVVDDDGGSSWLGRVLVCGRSVLIERISETQRPTPPPLAGGGDRAAAADGAASEPGVTAGRGSWARSRSAMASPPPAGRAWRVGPRPARGFRPAAVGFAG